MGGRSGRNGYLLVVVALLVAALVAVPQLARSRPVPTPADLAGVFTCDNEVTELEQYVTALGGTLIGGSNFFTFQGVAPPGVPVTGGTPDPDTGVTTFSRTLGPAQIFQTNAVEFLSETDVPGAEGPELVFGLGVRGAAGADGDDLGLKRLFNQNFGLPDEDGGDIGLQGAIDIDISANQAMTALPAGFRGRFEGVFAYDLPDGTTQVAGFRVEINNLGTGMAVPDQMRVGIAIKDPEELDPGDPDQAYFVVGQRAEFAGFDGGANQPGLGFRLDLALIDPGPTPTERDLVATGLDWSATPRQTALGWHKQCPSSGQFGWNTDPTGLPDPEAASLGIDFRLGDRTGQQITVDDGAGGTVRTRASEAVIDASIDGLPPLMDFIRLDDTLSFTRSAEVAPDVTVDRFQLAFEDPERDDELPLLATAQLSAMARHVLFLPTINQDSGAFERGELTSWTLTCPGETTPPGDPAPDDLRRTDLTATLPPFPGCERYNLAPVPSAQAVLQNWLPEDLDAQAATGDLRPPPLDANQFAYLATRDSNPLSSDGLFAFGAHVDGLERATVDLTGSPDNGARARLYVQREPAAPADDSARVVVDIAPEAGGRSGGRIAADATIDDLPDAVRVDYESVMAQLDLSWRANAPVAVRDGSFDAYVPGSDGGELHGALATGPVGGGPVPPAGRIQFTRGNSADHRGEVRYSAPEPLGGDDDVPIPEVPDYDPNVPARVHLGAELTDAADRAAGLGTRFHVDVEVPQPVELVWETDADGRVTTVNGGYVCDPGHQDPVVCQPTDLDVSVVRGPRTDLAALLTPPALPTPPAPVSAAVPAFTEFRPGSGVRGVVLGPDAWGAEAVIDGVARFTYHRDPLDVSVQLVDDANQPFRVNLLDASQVVDLDGEERPQVMFADAGIDRLPRAVRVRQRDPAAGPDEPWLWVSTDRLGIRDIDDVDWTEDPAGSRPRLTGVLRLGDAETLGDELAVDQRPTAVRDGSVPGADVWADYDVDTGLFAADASLALDLPRHVAVWRPTLGHCDDGDDQAPSCPDRPAYEREEVNDLGLRFQTTSHELGDLNVAGEIHSQHHDPVCDPVFGCLPLPLDGTALTARARVGHVPGSMQADLVMASNLRLPQTTVDLDVHDPNPDATSTPLGSVRAEVFDHGNPVDYQETGQCSLDGGPHPCTPNYAVSLTNVPANLHVTGRVLGVEPRLTPPPPPEPGADDIPVETGGVGFVHAQLDLLGVADQVVINAHDPGDGDVVGQLRAWRHLGTGPIRLTLPAPVSGFLNARMDHIVVPFHGPSDTIDPFKDFVWDSGGIGATIWRKLGGEGNGGRLLQPLLIGFDLAVATLCDIFGALGLGCQLTTDFDLDFDLPLYIGFDQVDTLRLGVNGITLSLDEHHPVAGSGAPATIATRQQPMDGEDGAAIDGAFFHHRNVELSLSGIGPFGGFDVSNDIDAPGAFGDVGLYSHADCVRADDFCWHLASNQVTRDQVSAATARSGYESGDVLLDFLFSPDNRNELDTALDDGEAGLQFYKTLTDDEHFPALTDEAFAVPALATQQVPREAATFDVTTSYCCLTGTFINFVSGLEQRETQDFGPVCELSDDEEVGAGPRAVASDGTEYVVAVQGATSAAGKPRTPCDATRLVLEAHYPAAPNAEPDALGPERWTVALATPAGLEPDGACHRGNENVRCEVAVDVDPQVDGSVRVTMDTTRIDDGVDGGFAFEYTTSSGLPGQRQRQVLAIDACCGQPDLRDGDGSTVVTGDAWVDASGHPGFHHPAATAVDGFGNLGVITDLEGNVSLDPCDIAPAFGCDPLPSGQTAQWLFGDGTTTGKLTGNLAVRQHRYPRNPDDFLFSQIGGILIHYDEDGEVIDTAHFTVFRL